MTGIIGFLIFICLVALAAVVIIYAAELVLAALEAPGKMKPLIRAIILMIALLIIMAKAIPMIGAYT